MRSWSSGDLDMTYKVTDALASKYKGAGLAVVATVDETMVDFHYIQDVFPHEEMPDPDDRGAVEELMSRSAMVPVVRQLQSLGGCLHFGMLSGWEFVSL